MTILALASVISSAPRKAAAKNDDFWAKKPIHTTALMAGKAHKAAASSVTRTYIPTTISGIPDSNEGIYEL